MKLFFSILLVMVLVVGVIYVATKPVAKDQPNSQTQLDQGGGKIASFDMTTPPQVADSTQSPSPTNSPTDSKEQTNMTATISTTMGDIKVKLFPKEAPKTVDNFTQLAAKNYYNDIIFHRVIADFMIQTGDPTGTGTGGASAFGKPFEDEINSHKVAEGALAMANAGPGTNGSQFFIVTSKRDTSYLDGKHTVFGLVTDGLDIAYKISNAKVDASDKPVETIKITGIKVEGK